MEKYHCVQALHRQGSTVEQACRILEISCGGYYGWLYHNPCGREQSTQVLRRRLVELHQKYPALGLDSLHHMLQPEFGCSHKRIHRQLRLARTISGRHRAYKVTINSRHSYPSCTEPSATKVLLRPVKSILAERYYLHSHWRAGSIWPSLWTCAPEELWAMPFLSASTHP